MNKKTYIIFFLVLSLFNKTFAQHYKIYNKSLHDYYGYFYQQKFDIVVNNLPDSINNDFGLEQICFTLHHARVSDIKVSLESPDGTVVWLANRNGADSGKNYLNTCLKQNGSNGLLNASIAPFTGEFIADGQIEFFNNKQNPNGIWKLIIEDLRKGVSGTLDSFTLSFSNNPAKTITKQKCSFESIELCQCKTNNPNCELLPDLVIVPYFTKTQIKEFAWNDPAFPGQLKLSAAIANIGLGPAEIKGGKNWYCDKTKVDSGSTCKNGKEVRLEVLQRIYTKNNNTYTFYERPAGTMYYENKPGHNHFHVDDWVQFRLIKKEKKSKKLICKGSKVSYCLFTNGRFHNNDSIGLINGKLYNESMPNYGLGFYPDCNFHKQGISVGGYDFYGLMYEGQFLQLPKNLKSGRYILEIEIDPNNWYKESNKNNNIFSTEIEILKQEIKK